MCSAQVNNKINLNLNSINRLLLHVVCLPLHLLLHLLPTLLHSICIYIQQPVSFCLLGESVIIIHSLLLALNHLKSECESINNFTIMQVIVIEFVSFINIKHASTLVSPSLMIQCNIDDLPISHHTQSMGVHSLSHTHLFSFCPIDFPETRRVLGQRGRWNGTCSYRRLLTRHRMLLVHTVDAGDRSSSGRCGPSTGRRRQ